MKSVYYDILILILEILANFRCPKFTLRYIRGIVNTGVSVSKLLVESVQTTEIRLATK